MKLLIVSDAPSEKAMKLIEEGAQLIPATLPPFKKEYLRENVDIPEEVKNYHKSLLQSQAVIFDLSDGQSLKNLLAWAKFKVNCLKNLMSASVIRSGKENHRERQDNERLSEELDLAQEQNNSNSVPNNVCQHQMFPKFA